MICICLASYYWCQRGPDKGYWGGNVWQHMWWVSSTYDILLCSVFCNKPSVPKSLSRLCRQKTQRWILLVGNRESAVVPAVIDVDMDRDECLEQLPRCRLLPQVQHLWQSHSDAVLFQRSINKEGTVVHLLSDSTIASLARRQTRRDATAEHFDAWKTCSFTAQAFLLTLPTHWFQMSMTFLVFGRERQQRMTNNIIELCLYWKSKHVNTQKCVPYFYLTIETQLKLLLAGLIWHLNTKAFKVLYFQ